MRKHHTYIHTGVRFLSVVSNWLYVVDYDLSTENESRRVYFYQKVRTMLLKHFNKPIEFSSQSCYFSVDQEVAEKFFEIAKQFCTRATMYRAQELERFGKREKQ